MFNSAYAVSIRLKLKVENTIRWQVNFDKDGNAIRESNAKLVKWSDGSLSMHLGSEIFDVYKQPLQVMITNITLILNISLK